MILVKLYSKKYLWFNDLVDIWGDELFNKVLPIEYVRKIPFLKKLIAKLIGYVKLPVEVKLVVLKILYLFT